MTDLEPSLPSEPINPAFAQGAQISLQAFNIPKFPPEAQELKALALTSDIKLDEYTSQLESFSPIPPLPQGIQSLTLELFSLGYPPGFLSALAQALPNLKSFDAYSQLLCGITPEAQADALAFFENSQNLRAIQLLDVFARPGFFTAIGQKLAGRKEKGLMFLQFNYTYRDEDGDFLARIPSNELPTFIVPSLVMCSFNIAAPDPIDDPEDPSNLTSEGEEIKSKPEGVMAFHKSSRDVLLRALTDNSTAPVRLRALNITLYSLLLEDLNQVLKKHEGLLVLNATVEIEPTVDSKEQLVEALKLCPELEQVEIVGNPTLAFSMAVMDPRRNALSAAFPSAEDMQQLSRSCPKLQCFNASILRTTTPGQVEWRKEGGVWVGGIITPKAEAS